MTRTLMRYFGSQPAKPSKTVEPLARVEVVEGALAVDREGLRVAGDVHRSPPDVLLRNAGCLTTRLSLGDAAGLRAGVGHQRAVLGDARVLLVADGVFVERARRKIAMDLGNVEAVILPD